jgi:hypothetical protein
MNDTIGREPKDSPYMLVPEILAGIFGLATVIIALGAIAATVFVPEGFAAISLAVIASLLCLAGGVAVVLLVAVIAIFTNSERIRIYSISFCALFLVITLVINVSAYGWFFYDPAMRAEYEADKAEYEEGIGNLFRDQLDDQTESGAVSSGYLEWRMTRDWGFGYEYYNIEGTRNGVPIYISASRYDSENWNIQLYPNVPIPEIDESISDVYIDQWRSNDGRLQFQDPHSGEWVDLAVRDPYFADAKRRRALNEIVGEDGVEFYLNWGTPQLTYYPNDSEIAGTPGRRRLSRYIEVLAELYPPEGTWDPALCTPYS